MPADFLTIKTCADERTINLDNVADILWTRDDQGHLQGAVITLLSVRYSSWCDSAASTAEQIELKTVEAEALRWYLEDRRKAIDVIALHERAQALQQAAEGCKGARAG